MYDLFKLLPGLTSNVPISLVSKEDAELYIRENAAIATYITTSFIRVDAETQAACYYNKYKKELIISLKKPEDYQLLFNNSDLTLKIVKTTKSVDDLLKETNIETAVEPKSIEHFAKLLKNELNEGIDRAVAKYLEASKHE
jgi:hypothetical protein